MLPTSMMDRAGLEAYADTLLHSGGARAASVFRCLANAQLPHGLTPLMLVTRHSDAAKAEQLIDLLMTHGAELGARDDRNREVLMYACEHGASPQVIDCLVKWTNRRAKWELKWADRDCDGRDSVVLASRAGHGELASHLLDQLDLERAPLENYPLIVLEAAIESENEEAAAAVLKNAKIRRELELAGLGKRVCNAWQRVCNLSTCVETAVRCGMPGVVQRMLEINGEKVQRATWYAIYKSKRSTGSNAEPVLVDAAFKKIADAYQREQLWQQMKGVLPLRHCEKLAEKEQTKSTWERVKHRMWYGARDWTELARHPLATLPDDVFDRIVSFARPSEEEDAQRIRFENESRRCMACKGVCIPGECLHSEEAAAAH